MEKRRRRSARSSACACGSPPPCGEGSGVGGRHESGRARYGLVAGPPPPPSPPTRAFTPVFDGLWGEGALGKRGKGMLNSTSVGRNPASVLPAPVGAISRTERPARAFASNSSWWARGAQPRLANQRANGSGRTASVSVRSRAVTRPPVAPDGDRVEAPLDERDEDQNDAKRRHGPRHGANARNPHGIE